MRLDHRPFHHDGVERRIGSRCRPRHHRPHHACHVEARPVRNLPSLSSPNLRTWPLPTRRNTAASRTTWRPTSRGGQSMASWNAPPQNQPHAPSGRWLPALGRIGTTFCTPADWSRGYIGENRQPGIPPGWHTTEEAGLNRTRDTNPAPIHLAALHMGHDSLDDLDDLLSKGANPNVKDNRGRTPLHHAAFYGYAENVQVLLAAGADPNARDNEGWTPLNAANSGRNDRRVIKMLRAAGGKRQSWLASLFRKGVGPSVNT